MRLLFRSLNSNKDVTTHVHCHRRRAESESKAIPPAVPFAARVLRDAHAEEKLEQELSKRANAKVGVALFGREGGTKTESP